MALRGGKHTRSQGKRCWASSTLPRLASLQPLRKGKGTVVDEGKGLRGKRPGMLEVGRNRGQQVKKHQGDAHKVYNMQEQMGAAVGAGNPKTA